MEKQQEPKPQPATKTELLLDVAMEAQYFRTSTLAVPLVLIPNHPFEKTPKALEDNYDFTSWLSWRCYKKHGFLASSALINAVIRYLTGLALYDEATPVWDVDTKAVALVNRPETKAPIAQPIIIVPERKEPPAILRPAPKVVSSGGIAA